MICWLVEDFKDIQVDLIEWALSFSDFETRTSSIVTIDWIFIREKKPLVTTVSIVLMTLEIVVE